MRQPAIVFTEYRDTLERLRDRPHGRRTRCRGPARRDVAGGAIGCPGGVQRSPLKPDTTDVTVRLKPDTTDIKPDTPSVARDRCRVRRTEPSAAVSCGRALRAALEPGPARAADGPRRSDRPVAPRARNPADRRRHGGTARPGAACEACGPRALGDARIVAARERDRRVARGERGHGRRAYRPRGSSNRTSCRRLLPRTSCSERAECEARRLRSQREWIAASGGDHDAAPSTRPGHGRSLRAGPVVSALRIDRSSLQPGLICVYTVTLSTERGDAVHTELAVVHEPDKPDEALSVARTPAAARRAIREFVEDARAGGPRRPAREHGVPSRRRRVGARHGRRGARNAASAR